MPNKKQLHQAKVDSLDSLGTNPDELIFEDELSMIENIAGAFIQRVKDNIEQEGMFVTGKMGDISIERTLDGFNLTAYPWLIYQDKGVSGTQKKYDTPFSYTDKMPPVDAIKEWIRRRGVNSERNDEYGGEVSNTPESAAFAIAKSIQKDGIEPKNFYSKEVQQLADDLSIAVANLVITQTFK